MTGTEKAEKVLSRCMPGIYCMLSYERFIHVLYQGRAGGGLGPFAFPVAPRFSKPRGNPKPITE